MSLEGKATAGQVTGRINKTDLLCISAYGIAVKHGYRGTEEEWYWELTNAKSAYQYAVAGGFEGSEDEFKEAMYTAGAVKGLLDQHKEEVEERVGQLETKVEEEASVRAEAIDNCNQRVDSAEARLGSIEGFMMHNAGSHNAIYRGKDLGEEVAIKYQEQILNGTFDDLYIGDYWTINGVVYRIAAFDYYFGKGDTACEEHHVTLVPDTALYSHAMNSTDTTDGAYANSLMRTEGLDEAKEIINEAFGGVFGILNHRIPVANATTSEYESDYGWYDSTVELMSERNVFGGAAYGNTKGGVALEAAFSLDATQFPLFSMRPDLIGNREGCWLRDVAGGMSFSIIAYAGGPFFAHASTSWGVRPSFSVYCNGVG